METKPLHCKCGAEARIRYRMPVFWVECKRKCGMRTGYFSDWYEQLDPESREEAVKAWNRMVSEKSF
jgi:hypothetical protein